MTTDIPDLLRQSVTAADLPTMAGDTPQPAAVVFFLPTIFSAAYHLPLPRELPPYWSISLGLSAYWSRDTVLRATIMHEEFWADAVGIAATKAAAQSWEVKGTRAGRWQELLVDWGGDGYVPSQMRGVADYCTTNNGEFWEVVRVSDARGSRVLGLVHLDSLRCVRTGDPERPVIFMDLRGAYHVLRDWQVINLCDMPDPSLSSLGIGHCAAERSYGKIYDLAAMELYFKEKITGAGANNLDIIQGMQTMQLEGILSSAEAGKQQRGLTYYQGNILAGTTTQGSLTHVRIPLRGMPDGFERREEVEIAQLAYASALGLDPQELNPQLVGRGALGIGAQSVVLAEKQAAKGLAARDKQLVHLLNTRVVSASVTFTFTERDLRDEKAQADIEATRAGTRAAQIASMEITPQEARQLAVDSGDLPKEFLPPQGDQTPDVAISDEEQPEAAEAATEGKGSEAVRPLTVADLTAPALAQAEKQANHMSATIAFILDESDSKALLSALPEDLPDGIEPVDDLHLTLVFLGKVNEIERQRKAIERALSGLRFDSPIVGTISGVGKFNNDEGDGTSAIYASFDAPDLPAFREALVKSLLEEGIDFQPSHGFTPHITLAYIANDRPLPPIDVPVIKLTFSSVTLAWANRQRKFPFVESSPGMAPKTKEANLILAWGLMREALGEARR